MDDINIEEFKKEILKFFVTFSRLEYALKANGFFYEYRGDVHPDWKKFARKIKDELDTSSDTSLQEAIKFILENPPKKQVVKSGKLDWENIPESQGSEIENLFGYIRRIRNNLFHGEKFTKKLPEKFDRDLSLVKNALLILRKTVEFDEDISRAFWDSPIWNRFLESLLGK